MKSSTWFPKFLLAAYLIFFTILGIDPYSRATWYVENGPIFGIVVVLAILYWRGVRFSNVSYALMSVLIFMHTIGGHYTFERVPFETVTQLLHASRNHYDRIAHFAVGFYAFPIAEYLLSRRLVKSKWLVWLFPIFTIATVAMTYELIEWIYAASSDPTAGAAFLGSQGDIWDAQKDMLADTLGAIAAIIGFATLRRKSLNELKRS